MPQLPRSEASLGQIISALEVWSRARAVGSQFAIDRKIAAIKALEAELVRLTCGDEWSRQEKKYRDKQLAINDLHNFISAPIKHNSLARGILMKEEVLPSYSILEIVDVLDGLARSHLDLSIFSTARDRGVNRQKWVTDFCYRLFLSPENIRSWSANDFAPAVTYVLKNPLFARVVRIVYLMCQVPRLNGAQSKAAGV
jgi:hypothetical protein